MNVWLFRAGAQGEYEQKFLDDGRIYLTWDKLKINLNDYKSRSKLFDKLEEIYDSDKKGRIRNWVSQIYPIAHRMKIGDWVVLPSKASSTVHIGRITGEYEYIESNGDRYYHSRTVDWFAPDIPRSRFDQDILYSFGAFMTVCRIHRNDAEKRLKEMYENGWEVPAVHMALDTSDDVDTSDVISFVSIEEQITDVISKYIYRKFKGYKMEVLIEEILKAKGYTTYHSPQGADGGVDILAAGGDLGFESPRICVQVKTQDDPVDRPTLDQLGGVMNNVNAEYGLLVSWNGFKDSVMREKPKLFFKIRLWSSKEVIEELFNNYDNLSDEIKAEIPLKPVWTLNEDEME